ncbi:MAG: ATP-binding protein [Pirellulaceae bacterium]
MRFAQISRTVRSLTFRLTAWNTLVVVLVGIAALVTAREGLRYTLLLETDGILHDEAAELSLAVEELYPDQQDIAEVLQRKSESHADHEWFLQLLDADGRTVWESENLPEKIRARSISPNAPSTIVALDGWHFAQRPIRRRGIPAYWIRIGTPTQFIDDDVNRITEIMIPAALIITMLSPLGGYVLARRAVVPLRQIINTTRSLRPTNLEERLPLRDTGDELDQLSGEINDFLDQIADHIDRQRGFLANAAHELRSPLAAIQGSLDVAISRKRSVEEYEELLPVVIDECARLTTLVNQLLVLAENEAKSDRAQQERVRLDEAVRKSIEMFSGVTEEQEVRMTADIEPGVEVFGCLPHLRQVIANLIDNAVKFTPSGGEIQVSLRRVGDDAVEFRVRDTGVGIEREDLPRVFDRFYRGDKAHQHAQGQYGSGLGLSICSAIVAAHLGTIEVESVPGEGTCFTLTLPALEKPPVAAESPTV